RHGVGQHVQLLRPGHAVRRLQGLGVRPRPRRRFAPRLHPGEERVDESRVGVAMDRLGEIVIFTGDIAGMRHFYEEQVGLVTREVLPDWVAFDTSGGTLALRLMHDSALRGVEMRFITTDLEARARALSQRGV